MCGIFLNFLSAGCTTSGDCLNGGQCRIPPPSQVGVQLQGQCQCQGGLQGPQCQGFVVVSMYRV